MSSELLLLPSALAKSLSSSSSLLPALRRFAAEPPPDALPLLPLPALAAPTVRFAVAVPASLRGVPALDAAAGDDPGALRLTPLTLAEAAPALAAGDDAAPAEAPNHVVPSSSSPSSSSTTITLLRFAPAARPADADRALAAAPGDRFPPAEDALAARLPLETAALELRPRTAPPSLSLPPLLELSSSLVSLVSSPHSSSDSSLPAAALPLPGDFLLALPPPPPPGRQPRAAPALPPSDLRSCFACAAVFWASGPQKYRKWMAIFSGRNSFPHHWQRVLLGSIIFRNSASRIEYVVSTTSNLERSAAVTVRLGPWWMCTDRAPGRACRRISLRHCVSATTGHTTSVAEQGVSGARWSSGDDVSISGVHLDAAGAAAAAAPAPAAADETDDVAAAADDDDETDDAADAAAALQSWSPWQS